MFSTGFVLKSLFSWPIPGNAGVQSAEADARGRRQSGRFACWPSAFPRSGPSAFLRTNPARTRVQFTAAASRPQPLGGVSQRWLAADSGRSASRAAPWRVGAWARPCGLAPRLGLRPPSAAASPSPSLYVLRRLRCRGGQRQRGRKKRFALHRSGSPGGLAPPRTPSRESRVAKRHRLVLNGNGGGEEEKRRR